MTSNIEATETAEAPVTDKEPKALKKASKKGNVGARRANVAPKKAKSGKKASSAKKAPKTRKGAKSPDSARDGSKAAKILDLLKRPGGVTGKDLRKATGWQPHSVRGFLSGTVRKKMGFRVVCTKGPDGERSYSIEA